ncbi:putative ribonuclease h protein [Fagus crenata]
MGSHLNNLKCDQIQPNNGGPKNISDYKEGKRKRETTDAEKNTESGQKKERLDRVVAGLDWSTLYPEAWVKHLSASASDHRPVQLFLNKQSVHHRRRRIFRFEQAWAREESCEETVKEAWQQHTTGSKMYEVTEAIKSCRRRLTKWDREVYRSSQQRLHQLGEDLRCMEERNHSDDTQDEHGVSQEEPLEIERIVVNYFSQIYSSTNPQNFGSIMEAVKRSVTSKMNVGLTQEFKAEEEFETMVGDLINRDTCQWNEQRLHATFGKEDIDAILSIPLSQGLPEDKLIWKTTSHGRFTDPIKFTGIFHHGDVVGCFGKGLVIQNQLRLGLFLGISSGLMFSATVALTRVRLTLTFKEEGGTSFCGFVRKRQWQGQGKRQWQRR